MNAKQMTRDEHVRKALLRGVVIGRTAGGPALTKDGVSAAKEVELPDPYEDVGAWLVQEVALRTSDATGDGTTTPTVLTGSMGFKSPHVGTKTC